MRTLLLILIAALALAAPIALAAPSAAGKAPLIIAMKDPGCHWFYVGGGPNHGSTSSPLSGRAGDAPQPRRGGTDRQGARRHQDRAVGAKLTLKAKGTYHITMVKQAPDDNHLLLKVT